MPSILELLKFKSIGIGTVQSVDEMTVVPLISDDEDHVVASPSSLKFERTTSYGSMVFKNEDSKPAIVPANYMVRGRGAQDHAMSGSGVIMGRQKTFNTACCIEQTQGGYLGSEGNDEDVLPIGLRKALLNRGKRDERHYGKLWDSINQWLQGTGVSRRSAAHLRDFYDNSQVHDELEKFTAEFEPVEGQIGALIMFSGVPVGLEIMPTNEHWRAYWMQLLRGCYGAELIRLKMINKLEKTSLIMPDIPDDASAEQIKNILENFVLHLQKEAIPILKGINIDSAIAMSRDSDFEVDLVTSKMGNHNGGGDVILKGSRPLYISLVL